MTMRMAALLVGLMLWVGPAARAESPLYHPSVRALAAADDDEPPRHEDRLARKRQPVKEAAPVEEAPIYKKWWFWALAGAVVGGTVIFGVATFKPAQHVPSACPVGTLACFGDGRMP
jgi:hypothetical protein